MVDARQTFGLAVCLSVRIMQLSGAVMIVRVFVTMHIMRTVSYTHLTLPTILLV